MNRKNLLKVKAWLEAGAPHANFDMDKGVEVFDNAARKSKNECGTVCCIAGAAYQMSLTKDGSFPSVVTLVKHMEEYERSSEEVCWGKVRDKAMEFLDLNESDLSLGFGHPLFDPNKAPQNCKPQQAAKAVQNLINDIDKGGDGSNCWEGIK